MKKAIVLLMLIASTSFSQINTFFNEGLDFVGIGTEPFWDLKIDAEKSIAFYSLGSENNIITDKPIYVPIMDAAGFAYLGQTETYSVNVQIMKETCSDGMSDNTYSYSVRVSIFNKTNAETIEYKGCGYYAYDYRLNDIWVLEKLNGKEITKEQYIKNRPYIEFRLREDRLGGNAGCNNFFGKVEAKGNKITFPNNYGMTMIACPENLIEREFIKTITGKTLEYKIDNGKLYLFQEDEAVMEFRKTD